MSTTGESGFSTRDELGLRADSALTQDSDGDGVTDAQEGLDGTDPYNASELAVGDVAAPTLYERETPQGDVPEPTGPAVSVPGGSSGTTLDPLESLIAPASSLPDGLDAVLNPLQPSTATIPPSGIASTGNSGFTDTTTNTPDSTSDTTDHSDSAQAQADNSGISTDATDVRGDPDAMINPDDATATGFAAGLVDSLGTAEVQGPSTQAGATDFGRGDLDAGLGSVTGETVLRPAAGPDVMDPDNQTVASGQNFDPYRSGDGIGTVDVANPNLLDLAGIGAPDRPTDTGTNPYGAGGLGDGRGSASSAATAISAPPPAGTPNEAPGVGGVTNIGGGPSGIESVADEVTGIDSTTELSNVAQHASPDAAPASIGLTDVFDDITGVSATPSVSDVSNDVSPDATPGPDLFEGETNRSPIDTADGTLGDSVDAVLPDSSPDATSVPTGFAGGFDDVLGIATFPEADPTDSGASPSEGLPAEAGDAYGVDPGDVGIPDSGNIGIPDSGDVGTPNPSGDGDSFGSVQGDGFASGTFELDSIDRSDAGFDGGSTPVDDDRADQFGSASDDGFDG